MSIRAFCYSEGTFTSFTSFISEVNNFIYELGDFFEELTVSTTKSCIYYTVLFDSNFYAAD